MSNLFIGGCRHAFGRIFGFEAIRRTTRSRDPLNVNTGSIAKRNRHTGQPHEHKREIARRLRQQARRAAKVRGGDHA